MFSKEWTPIIWCKLLHPLAVLPHPAHGYHEDAGADLISVEAVSLLPVETKLIATGLSLELPEGFEAQIRSRSGLALKGIVVANSPGTIDPGYRGEVKVILANRTNETYRIQPCDRIAQMVIAKYAAPEWGLTDSLLATKRGSGGFGSTGLRAPEEPILTIAVATAVA